MKNLILLICLLLFWVQGLAQLSIPFNSRNVITEAHNPAFGSNFNPIYKFAVLGNFGWRTYSHNYAPYYINHAGVAAYSHQLRLSRKSSIGVSAIYSSTGEGQWKDNKAIANLWFQQRIGDGIISAGFGVGRIQISHYEQVSRYDYNEISGSKPTMDVGVAYRNDRLDFCRSLKVGISYDRLNNNPIILPQNTFNGYTISQKSNVKLQLRMANDLDWCNLESALFVEQGVRPFVDNKPNVLVQSNVVFIGNYIAGLGYAYFYDSHVPQINIGARVSPGWFSAEFGYSLSKFTSRGVTPWKHELYVAIIQRPHRRRHFIQF